MVKRVPSNATRFRPRALHGLPHFGQHVDQRQRRYGRRAAKRRCEVLRRQWHMNSAPPAAMFRGQAGEIAREAVEILCGDRGIDALNVGVGNQQARYAALLFDAQRSARDNNGRLRLARDRRSDRDSALHCRIGLTTAERCRRDPGTPCVWRSAPYQRSRFGIGGRSRHQLHEAIAHDADRNVAVRK